MNEPVPASSYPKKSYVTFVKPITAGEIIGATFITLVSAHWIIQHKNAVGLETFSLSCDTPPELPLKMIRGIVNTKISNKETILPTAELQFENHLITIYMYPYLNTLDRLTKISERKRAIL